MSRKSKGPLTLLIDTNNLVARIYYGLGARSSNLPDGAEDTVWALTDKERRALGYEPLPTDLFRALESFEASELMARTLGEQVFEYFLRNKHAEWQRYREQVTPVELESTFFRI